MVSMAFFKKYLLKSKLYPSGHYMHVIARGSFLVVITLPGHELTRTQSSRSYSVFEGGSIYMRGPNMDRRLYIQHKNIQCVNLFRTR